MMRLFLPSHIRQLASFGRCAWGDSWWHATQCCQSKPEPDEPVKEEVEGSSVSSQQLEPEYLNCAVDVFLYRRRRTLLPETSYEKIENGEETGTSQVEGIMELEPVNYDTVDQNTKRSSGEWSSADDGKADVGSLSECNKRSKLFQDSQTETTDGDEAVSDSPVVTHQKPPENVPESLQTCEDSREMGDCVKNKPDKPPSDLAQEENLNTVEILNKDVTDEICSSQTSLGSEPKKIAGQLCTAEKELSLDTDEDIYRDEEEIEKEKIQKGITTAEKDTKEDLKLGVGPEVDIIEYCQREWRGKTSVAKKMKEGYEEVSHFFGSIRRVRGDNYCALRATLFQCLSQMTQLPRWMDDDRLIQLPEKLVKKYDWIKQWRFWHSYGSKKTTVLLKESLELLKKKWSELSEIQTPDKKQAACDEIFQSDEEYCLYEAVKFLMLKTAIDLFNANEDGKEVPVFSWLLFARNTSKNPCEFLKNHLNHVGHSGGLEQVEMFLLGYTLQHTIKVYRLYKYGTDEFITHYPNDQADWPVVTLITEDDRHYNVPVRVCEETSL